MRGDEINLTSFACTGAVTSRAPSSAGDIGYAALGNVSFSTRGASPRNFTLNACFTHPTDDAKPWWVSKLTIGTCW